MNEQKKPIGLRLIDGNEVVGFQYEDISGKAFSHLLRVAVHPSGQATLIPYVDIESFEEKIKIKEEHIILRYTPTGSVWNQHEGLCKILKQKKTGIITPESKIIK